MLRLKVPSERQKFLERLRTEVTKSRPASITLYYAPFAGRRVPAQLNALLSDVCTERYQAHLDKARQVKFKGGTKSFVRTYKFLGTSL